MSVDLTAELQAAVNKTLASARQSAERGEVTVAAQAYRKAADLMRRLARATRLAGSRRDRLSRAQQYETIAEALLDGRLVPGVDGSIAPIRTPEDHGGGTDEGLESRVEELIHRSSVTWADIGGLEATKQEIKLAYGLSLARKPSSVQVSGWRNILLYGPPGTGKTLLAAATSSGLEATFYDVKVSSLLSKYFGESTQLITALYESARRNSPSVVFLDEFDALAGDREAASMGAERRIMSTLLSELDGLAGKNTDQYVLTIAATNAPWLMDPAILSRFEKQIHVPLPDAEARASIFRIHTEGAGCPLQCPVDDLVALSEGLSGREIKQICQKVVGSMISRVNPGISAAVDQGVDALRSYELTVEPLTRSEFVNAMQDFTAGTSAAMISRYETWRGR